MKPLCGTLYVGIFRSFTFAVSGMASSSYGIIGRKRVECFTRIPVAPLILALLTVTACSDSSAPRGPGPVHTITVSLPPHSLSALGESVTLTATLKDASGVSITDKQVTWSSGNGSVASVGTTTGVVTATGNGTAQITASADGKSGSATVTVHQVVTAVAVASSGDTIRSLNDTLRYAATARDSRNNVVSGNRSVTWGITGDGVATVDQGGLVTGSAEGSFTVTATVDGVSGSRPGAVKQRGAALRIITEPAGAKAGLPLATQPSLEVLDAKGNRVLSDNATVVTAQVGSGGGGTVGEATATAANGVATFQSLGVGGLKGGKSLHFAAAGVDGASSAVFQMGAGTPTAFLAVAGNNQSAPAATVLAQPLTVNVIDAFGNGVDGVSIGWSVVAGGGAPATSDALTNDAGESAVGYTLGVFAGLETVRATLPASALPPVDFTVQATPNATIAGTMSLASQFLSASTVSLPAASASKVATGPVVQVAPSSFAPKGAFGEFRNSPADRGQVATFGPTSAGGSGLDAVAGELIVVFRGTSLGLPNVGAVEYRNQSVAQATALAIRGALAPVAATGAMTVVQVAAPVHAALVRLAPGVDSGVAAAQLRSDPRILAVEPNYVVRTAEHRRTPMDRLYESRVAISRNSTYPVPNMPSLPDSRLLSTNGAVPNDPHYPAQAWHYNMIDLPRAWELTTGNSDVIVAVVDDGIRFDHPAFGSNLTNDGYDFVSTGSIPICAGGFVSRTGDGNGYDPDPAIPVSYLRHPTLSCVLGTSTSGGHGLHVAGTIGAAGNDGVNITGVAWNVRIRPVRVLDVVGSGTHMDIIQGILYSAGLPADNGVGGTVSPPTPAHVINLSLGGSTPSIGLETAVNAAYAAGSLVIAAAGNDATSIPFYPASYPAAVSVSAVGPSGLLASYSNFGANIEIAAPGGDNAGLDESQGVWSARWNFVLNQATHEGIQGTSMAAPHVSGVAALIFAANPGITAQQVRARLTSYAVDLGPPGHDIQYGAGLVNAYNALTQSFGPPISRHVRLLDANTGATVATTPAMGGSFSFGALPDGNYRVYGGTDENGDGRTGLPIRFWGALGGAAIPTTITVNGAATHGANFSAGFPSELEPNGAIHLADALPVNGYMLGQISTLADEDFFRVQIPTAGSYRFETIGWIGACGFALESDTRLSLLNSSGTEIASNDDLNFAQGLLCSRITANLQPGTYYLKVTGWDTGTYAVMVRPGDGG